MFYFVRNLQNDVVAITDANGNVIVRYEYDPWGVPTIIADGENYNIGYANMIRYRGYFYDVETELYYLQSRYYDPTTGRFINADDKLYSDTFGNNMYVYCGNNPVNRSDETGQGWWPVASAVVGAVVGAAVTVATNVSKGEKWYKGVAAATVGGAVGGLIIGISGNTVAAAKAATVASCLVGSAVESLVNEASKYNKTLAKINGETVHEASQENIEKSMLQFSHDTVVGGLSGLVLGEFAGMVVSTNAGWFKPQKLLSCITGEYAIRNNLQSVVCGVATYLYNAYCYAGEETANQSESAYTQVF